MAPLPPTYAEFIKDWNDRFPFTFDAKVLAFKSMAFYKTSLGDEYQKCSQDDKFKNNLRFEYDEKNGFCNYVGEAALSHYHEAAYDAYMTGFVFAHILKFKELDTIKYACQEQIKALKKDRKAIVEINKQMKE